MGRNLHLPLRAGPSPPQGCLAPVRVVIPRGSILDPSAEAAVVGGNVLTSQRVVDVILAAFGACAASQVRRAGGAALSCWEAGCGEAGAHTKQMLPEPLSRAQQPFAPARAA